MAEVQVQSLNDPATTEGMPGNEPGLVDPRHLRPAPADPPAGPSAPLELVPLRGPTEASDAPPLVDESAAEGLVDPRALIPIPGDPTGESGSGAP